MADAAVVSVTAPAKKETTPVKKATAPAKKAVATKAPAAKKVSAQKPASAKPKGEVDHGRKNAKTASKAAPATVQSLAPKPSKGAPVARAAQTAAKRPVAKTKAKE